MVTFQQFIDAACKGNAEVVSQYLQEEDPNAPSKINDFANEMWTSTALILAAQAGHVGVVDVLLAHPQIDVMKFGGTGSSALMSALYANQEEKAVAVIAKLLPRVTLEHILFKPDRNHNNFDSAYVSAGKRNGRIGGVGDTMAIYVRGEIAKLKYMAEQYQNQRRPWDTPSDSASIAAARNAGSFAAPTAAPGFQPDPLLASQAAHAVRPTL